MIRKTNRYILAFDPSGNFNEGKGTTGWCLFDGETKQIAKFGVIKASQYPSLLDYWDAHIKLIDDLGGYSMDIVIEDYYLYSSRSDSQINSRFETPKLIGALQYECYLRNIKVTFQAAALVKKRWADNILEHKGLIKKNNKGYKIGSTILSEHNKDAIRHAVHYATFRRD